MTYRQWKVLSVWLAVAGVACAPTGPEEQIDAVRGALTGNIVISGKVSDSSGSGIAGVTVTLAGSASKTQQTGAAGTYSFGGLAAGSYSVRPTKVSCAFVPDVVNFNNLKTSKVQNFTGSGAGCAAGVTPTTRKYMTLIYNPIIESQGGARLIDLEGWNQPDPMAVQFVADLAQGSHGLAVYQAGPRLELDQYPVHEDGFQYTDDTYLACLGNKALCHKPDQEDGFGYAADYLAILNQNNVCARFNAGEFDELWMFGGPYMGFWEANQAGSQAINTNGPPVIGSTCQGRLNIFGFSYHVGETNMLHDYGHRIEGTMSTLLPSGSTLFTEFTRFDAEAPGQAQCGTVHRPPNSDANYDYGNPRVVTSRADDWLNYPNRTGATTSISCTAWGCDERLFHLWWETRLPHVAGTAADGSSNNWWTYILDTAR